jgi:hypothetical protein
MVLLINTYLYLRYYIAEFLLERETFPYQLVDKVGKKRFWFNNLFSKTVPFVR